MNLRNRLAKPSMAEHLPTYIGQVKHMLGSTVTVELDTSLAGVAPIYKGHLQQVGQIGSLVRIPQGLVDLIGSVSLLGISELSGVQEPTKNVQNGNRWLQVQLLGEVDRGTGLILAPVPRERERWYALWLLTQGWTAQATAEALERDPHTIGRWLAAFGEGGPTALIFEQSGGAPPPSKRRSRRR